MTVYTVQPGDTFERISRRVYGVESGAALIRSANPGASDPPISGSILTIPANPDQAPRFAARPGIASNPEEVALALNGKRFRFWEEISITQSIDTLSSVEFLAPFEPSEQSHRDTFRPFTYPPAIVTVGGSPLFTGTAIAFSPSLQVDRRSVTVSCYSAAGVLNDCTPPASAFPLEYTNQTLRQIAEALAAPFGVSVVFSDDPGPAFDVVAIDPGKSILQSLADLAKQRNLVITDNPSGALVFQKAVKPGRPVAVLRQGDAPVGDISAQFNPQGYYSHITGLQPAAFGVGGSKYTAENPRLRGVLRPHVYTAPDTDDGDIKTAVEAKAGRMFGRAVSYVVPVGTWRDPSGRLWRPNTTVAVDAPGAMIYGQYEFILREVTFERQADRETAILTLCLPGAFSGQIPERLPWDE